MVDRVRTNIVKSFNYYYVSLRLEDVSIVACLIDVIGRL